jgi:hypothetical protein
MLLYLMYCGSQYSAVYFGLALYRGNRGPTVHGCVMHYSIRRIGAWHRMRQLIAPEPDLRRSCDAGMPLLRALLACNQSQVCGGNAGALRQAAINYRLKGDWDAGQ